MHADLALFFHLVRAETRWFEQVSDELFAATGTRLGDYDLLQVIDSVDGCRVQDIVREIGITVGAVSKAVDRLERDGLAERTPNPADRRSSIIRLTDTGAATVARATPVVVERVGDRLARLGDDERQSLASGLAALLAALEPPAAR